MWINTTDTIFVRKKNEAIAPLQPHTPRCACDYPLIRRRCLFFAKYIWAIWLANDIFHFALFEIICTSRICHLILNRPSTPLGPHPHSVRCRELIKLKHLHINTFAAKHGFLLFLLYFFFCGFHIFRLERVPFGWEFTARINADMVVRAPLARCALLSVCNSTGFTWRYLHT